jgi:predicted PurR-regulated permease PerM
VPVLVSLLLAYTLEPAVVLLMRCRLPRLGAAAVVYLALAIVAGSLARTVRDQVDSFAGDLPATISRLPRGVQKLDLGPANPLARVQRAVRAFEQAGTPTPAPPPGVRRVTVTRPLDVRAYLRGAAWTLMTAGAGLLTVALLTFVLLASGDLYKRKLITLAGPRLADKKITLEVIRGIDVQIERYLVARLLISVFVAAATGVGLALIGVSHPVVWGAVAGALNVVPFIGPTIAIALISVAALVQFESVESAAAAFGVSTLVAIIEGNIVSPWMLSRAGELNVVAVFVSVLFWGWMWDVWGLLLAVPIMVAIKAAADHIEPLQPIGELLGR